MQTTSTTVISTLVVVLAYFAISALGNTVTGTAPTVKPQTQCVCAVMNSTSSDDKHLERPLTLPLKCDAHGEEQCKKLCIALANSTAEDPEGKTKLCKYYHKDGRLFVHVFSKICDRSYVFTGIESKEPVCCHNNASVPCA